MLVAPSPKLQDQVLTVPVEESVNCTGRGAAPLVGLAVKLATGGAGFTVIDAVFTLEPLELLAVKVTP